MWNRNRPISDGRTFDLTESSTDQRRRSIPSFGPAFVIVVTRPRTPVNVFPRYDVVTIAPGTGVFGIKPSSRLNWSTRAGEFTLRVLRLDLRLLEESAIAYAAEEQAGDRLSLGDDVVEFHRAERVGGCIDEVARIVRRGKGDRAQTHVVHRFVVEREH